MALIPWRHKRGANGAGDSLTAPASRLRDEMDRMIERFFGEPWGFEGDLFGAPGTWMPTLDLSETDKEFTVRAEIPGVDPKDIDISISGNVLTIKGEKKEATEQKDERYYRSERRYGTFRRSLQLPAEVDADQVSAEHAQGVLTVRLHKKAEAALKKVPVKAAE